MPPTPAFRSPRGTRAHSSMRRARSRRGTPSRLLGRGKRTDFDASRFVGATWRFLPRKRPPELAPAAFLENWGPIVDTFRTLVLAPSPFDRALFLRFTPLGHVGASVHLDP